MLGVTEGCSENDLMKAEVLEHRFWQRHARMQEAAELHG